MLTVNLLGQFDVHLNGKPVEIPSRPAQSLLAYLLLNAGTTQRRERLAGLLWSDASESSARANLRHALWRLRQAIGADYILADRVSITFDAHSDYWLDAAVLDKQPLAGGSADDLIEAVSAYAGELLPGFYDEWVTWERERLNAVYEDRVQVLLERLVAEERWQETCEWGERWIAGGQVPEPAYRALMEAHAGLGDQAGMVEAYQRCVEVLEGELGVAASQETVQLFQRLSTGDTAPRPSVETGPPRRRTNLPTPPTPFVGREALLAEIAACLQEPACRLLTLVGPGGCGKTRLALEAAAARVDAHAHGVFFVPLAPLDSAEEIVPTIAQALGFSFYGSAEGGGDAVPPRQQLLNYLSAKSMLLVMDNYEHLLDGAGLVTQVLQTAPQIKILATSRANLNLQDEHLFPVAGMDVPDPGALERAIDYSAVKLFLDAAHRTEPRFAASAENLRDVVRICRLVEGMPLGVLLAAGWVRTLNLAEIASEIEQGLDFLETDLQDVPERQRSVRAVFDHSWKLLSDQEQEVLAQLSVFRGGFTRRAGQAVTGATLRELKGLVDKSLLDHTTAGRYQLHELLRQYAAEKLGRSPAVLTATRDRHGAYYAGFLARRAEELKGPRQQAALAEIEADAENARAAWNWAVEQGRVEWLDHALEGLCMFYEWRGRYEQGDQACTKALEALAASESGQARKVMLKILSWQVAFGLASGHTGIEDRAAKQVSALLNERGLAGHDMRSERAFALLQLGISAGYRDPRGGRQLLEQSLALYRQLGDQWREAYVLSALAVPLLRAGDFDTIEQLCEASLAIQHSLGDQRGIVQSLYWLTDMAWHQGDYEKAVQLGQENLARARQIGELSWAVYARIILAVALATVGRTTESFALFEESLAIANDVGSRALIAYSLIILSGTEAFTGRYKQARAHRQVALVQCQEMEYKFGIARCFEGLGVVALAEEAHVEAYDLLRESLDTYRLFPDTDEYAIVVAELGLAARGLGNPSEAREHLGNALRMASAKRHLRPMLFALAGFALLMTDKGQVEPGVGLYALVSGSPYVANFQWFEDVVGKHIAAVAAALPPDVVAAAQERGRARDLQATVRELLEELET